MDGFSKLARLGVVSVLWAVLAGAGWPGLAQAQEGPVTAPTMPDPPAVALVDLDGFGVQVRQAPNGPVIRTVPGGTVMTSLGEVSPSHNGFLWERVRDSQGNEGWIRTDNLLPLAMRGA